MPEIKGKVTVDTSDLSRGEQRIRQFDQVMQQSFKREKGARGRRVLEESIGDIASGNITGALTTITSKLSVLGIAGGAAAGVLVMGFTKAWEHAEKMEKSVEHFHEILARIPAAGASLEQLKASFEEINKNIDESKLNKYQKALIGIGLGAIKPEQAEQQARLSHEFAVNLDRQVDKSRELSQVTLLQAAGHKEAAERMKSRIEVGEQVAAIEDEAEKRNVEIGKKKLPPWQEAQQLAAVDSWRAKTEDITKSTAERADLLKSLNPLMERSRLSDKELSEGSGTLADRLRLQQAHRLEALGETFRKQGNVNLAAEQFAQAAVIREQIGGMKATDKPEYALKSAIESSQVFQKMLERLGDIVSGVGKISFANQ